MSTDSAFARPGRFFKGNLHTHSTLSDGALPPERVAAVYRDAGYDFFALTDHFLEKYGFPVADTRGFRTGTFTTLIGAEVHAPATELGEIWHILAVGLPLDFAPTAPGETGPDLARRCRAAGAFVAIAHPAWYGLTLADAETLDAAHAVEIYNHTSHVLTDRGDGAGLLDQMLARGRRPLVIATDDAHFHHDDALGGWVMVKAEENEPEALLAALEAGAFYASQGPEIHDLAIDGDRATVVSSPARAVMALGIGSAAARVLGDGLTRTVLDLAPLRRRGDVARFVVVDAAGRRAWSNPIPIGA